MHPGAVRVAAVFAFLASAPLAALAGDCRQGPEASTVHCALPNTLGNFQGYYLCDASVRLGKPTDKYELAELVGHFPRVKGVGVGHSWWGTQFCSGNTSSAIGIVTTELNATLEAILNPVYYNSSVKAPPDWPIQIDESKHTVIAAAGVPQRILLDSLAEYSSPLAPNGYTIAAFPWYIDQTIAGAVSTGTHGSSFQHGSVSSQTVRIEMALANGTLVNFTKDSNPVLWHAAQIAVGRLGVITEVELSIIPQDMVERTEIETDFWYFVDSIKQLQNDYNQALAGKGPNTVAQVLADYEGTQLFWFVPDNKTIWLKYNSLEMAAEKVLASEFQAQVATSSLGGSSQPTAAPNSQPLTYTAPSPSSSAPGPYLSAAIPQELASPALSPVLIPADDPITWNSLQYGFLSGWLTNGTFTRRDSILAETAMVNKATSDTDPYDQYEFSIPLQNAGDCIGKIADAMYSEDLLLGFPVPPLIRFVGEEDAFISNANGGPRIFFNIEDHQSYQTQNASLRFDAVVRLMRGPECKGRMHWGKAGWDKWANCFDGAKEYNTSWCNFGCAVKALDPNSKFASQSDVWTWRATMGGQDVPFEQCCGENGFKAACVCSSRNDCTYKPPFANQLTPR